ncbi:MAG: hypothetical protein JKY54_19735 [Flavobacteriales bacterium]|nr:hypothetical protein [Flavobacteriales bacterium]
MKTWWNYAFLIVIAIAAPFVAGLLPTYQYKGNYIGGGPIRQFFINHVADMLPSDKAQNLVDMFMASSAMGEYLIYLPIALNISMILLIILFAIGTLLIEGNNFVKNSIYQSKRKRAKGA